MSYVLAVKATLNLTFCLTGSRASICDSPTTRNLGFADARLEFFNLNA